MNINDLPPEVLATIFGHLQKHPDRTRAGKVCQLWDSIIEQTLGYQKWIGNGSKFWENQQTTRWSPLLEVSRSGISDCFLSEVTDKLSTFSEPSQATFVFPNLVKKIEFDGFISQPIYENLISPLRHLTTLVLHLSTLTLIEVNLEDKNIRHTLTKLFIAGEGFTKSHFPLLNMKTLFKNFCFLCNAHFPRLQWFGSTMPILLDKEVKIFFLLAKFVDRHYTTLRELELKWTEPWRINGKNSSPRTLEEQEAVKFELLQSKESVDTLEMISNSVKNWKFQTMLLVVEDWDLICPTTLPIKTAIMSQNKLQKLYYMCWDYIPMPVEMLQRNSATLTDIGLTLDDIFEPINCAAFSECIHLSKLALQTDGKITFNDLANEAPRLKNVQDLPLSLNCIRLRNIYIDSHNVEWVAKNLTKLHTLILVNIGKVDNLGISIPCLLWIMKYSPKIKILKVKGLNNMCHMASFGLKNFPVSPICPTCQTMHQGRDITTEDQIFLQSFLKATDHLTVFMPLIKKSNGNWHRCYNKL